jgi:hypothetical protein
MPKQLISLVKVRRRPIFFPSIKGGCYFRIKGVRRNLIYYKSTKGAHHPVLSNGTISRRILKLAHVSLSTWVDVLKGKEIGIGDGAWEDEEASR